MTSFGDRIAGPAIDHFVMAERDDQPGGESLDSGAESYVQRSRWRIRRHPAIAALNPSWTMIDDDGHPADIEAVEEAAGPRRRFWSVLTRRAGGAG